jgi:hypothetical protein
MSKFEELCKLYEIDLKNWTKYKEECFLFAQKLVGGFVNYCDLPQSQLKILSINGREENPYNISNIPHSIELNNDTYWHLWIAITIYPGSSMMYPQQSIVIKFRFKKENGKFIVKINPGATPNDEAHKIDITSELDFETFYNFLFQKILDFLENSLQKFLEGKLETKFFGFTLNSAFETAE